MFDTDTIKAISNLQSIVIETLGEPQNKKWLCPFHQENTPSFTLWNNDERFKCHGCGAEGDVIEFVMRVHNLDFSEACQRLNGSGFILDLTSMTSQIDKRREEREQVRLQNEQAAIDKLAAMSGKVDWYHNQVSNALEYWHSQGIDNQTIGKYRLGYAPKCPTYPDSPSYVIPYFDGGQLVSIRHRLANPNGSGKYRPEFCGLPVRMFNTDVLSQSDEIPFWLIEDSEVVIVEGEVKAIVLTERGFKAVGVPGITSWQPEWANRFAGIKRAFIAFDPTTPKNREQIENTTNKVAQNLLSANINPVICHFPCKPDDFFVLYGGSVDDFLTILEQGRRYA